MVSFVCMQHEFDIQILRDRLDERAGFLSCKSGIFKIVIAQFINLY